ncbi:MAG: hypothetical protein FJW39_17295 [Acidobacteria bacterium]|nr:hypothetical protein [Acidobacteriota bacterium]
MFYTRLTSVLLTPVLAFCQNSFTVSTIAGANSSGDGGRATNANFSSIEGIAADAQGNLYIADAGAHRIRRVSPEGIITTLAGTSTAGYSPDDTPADKSLLNSPYSVAAGTNGHLFIADLGNALVRCISPAGLLRTVPGPTPAIEFRKPRSLAVDFGGSVYVSDFDGHRVYRITPNGAIEVAAGTGTAGFDNNSAAPNSRLRAPAGLALDLSGSLYIADSGNGAIRRVFAGQIQTVAGGFQTPSSITVDPAGALYTVEPQAKRITRITRLGERRTFAPEIKQPRDIAAAPNGDLFAAESTRVWRITPSGSIVLHAGAAENAPVPEDVPSETASLASPIHLSFDTAGNLYVTEQSNRRVRRISTTGFIRTVADSKLLADPVAAVMDSRGVLRVAEFASSRVVAIAPNGSLTVVAGDGRLGFGGDNSLATGARLNRPRDIALDRQGNLYIADSLNHRIRRVGVNGIITTVAGNGTRGFAGDGRLATQAQLNSPQGMLVDPAGALYIADTGNHRIRKMLPNGVMTTVAGNGAAGDEGDGGLAIQAALNTPSSLAMDAAGGLLIADSFNHKIRRVDKEGVIQTLAGDGTPGSEGDGEDAQAARFRIPVSVAADAAGVVYVADHENHRIRKLTPVAAPVAELPEVLLIHAATRLAGPFAAGQLVIAPAPPAAGIFVGGAPINPLSVTGGQVLFRLPETTAAELAVNGRPLRLQPASPGIFAQDGKGQAAALNEDGSFNSESNPAARGTPLTFFLTGEGRAGLASLEVRVGAAQAEVLFAGPAPGLPGVAQVNAQLPGIFTPPGVRALTVVIGGAPSPAGVTVAVK